MNDLWNRMKGAASATIAQMGQNRWGLVTDVRQTDTGYLARVMVQPEQVMSGWLPVLAPMVGSGWGLVCPPEPGMQAFIAPDCGDGHHGVIVGLSYSNAAMPPVPKSNFNQTKGVPVGPGEIALVSKYGSVLRLCPDGSIHIEGDVRINGNLTVQNAISAVTGNITAQQADVVATKGNVSDTHGSVDRLRANYDRHTHPNNGFPNPIDPE